MIDIFGCWGCLNIMFLVPSTDGLSETQNFCFDVTLAHLDLKLFVYVRIHIHSGQMTVEYDRFLETLPCFHLSSLAEPGVIIGQAPWKTPHQKMHTVDMWNINAITFHSQESKRLILCWFLAARPWKDDVQDDISLSFGNSITFPSGFWWKQKGSLYIFGCGPLQGFQWQPWRFFLWNSRAWNLTNWYPKETPFFWKPEIPFPKHSWSWWYLLPWKLTCPLNINGWEDAFPNFPTDSGSHYSGPRIVRFSGVGFSIHVGNLNEAQLGIGWSTRIVDCLGSLAGIFHVGRRLERNCSNKTDLLLRWFQELGFFCPPPKKRRRLIWILKGCFSWHLNQLC